MTGFITVTLLILAALVAWMATTVLPKRRQASVDRRRIFGLGATTQALVTHISSPSRGNCWVHLEYRPDPAGRTYRVRQLTLEPSAKKLGLMVGSGVSIRYLPEEPAQAFVHELVLAERGLPVTGALLAVDACPQLFYVSFVLPNTLNWTGQGDIVVFDSTVQFNAFKSRSFWYPKRYRLDVAVSSIWDVGCTEERVQLAISGLDGVVRKLRFQAANGTAAAALCQRLPTSKTNDFVESSAYSAALSQLQPDTPVTYGLVVINLLTFAVTVALGGGFLSANPEVMIGLGTDYTPLTLGGQWWRLFTAMFLHFGLLHIGFNMWALLVNGQLAERVFGHARYLFIYVVAGLAASIASLLWHPIVNGAGASGAIFGVLGAMMAFFAKREPGVPASVAKAQLGSAAAYALYALIFAARVPGIDNAAHLGGLLVGFILGLILSQPIDASARAARPWKRQWTLALGLVCVATLLLAFFLATGKLTPRIAHDNYGRPIPRESLTPLRVFGGIRLHVTTDDLLTQKGAPIAKDENSWVYNSVDATHDGVITAFFSAPTANNPRSVRLVEFMGHDQTSAPAEMPYLNASAPEDVIRRYGAPVRNVVSGDTTFLWFGNGVFVGIRKGRVYRYGIGDLASLD